MLGYMKPFSITNNNLTACVSHANNSNFHIVFMQLSKLKKIMRLKKNNNLDALNAHVPRLLVLVTFVC